MVYTSGVTVNDRYPRPPHPPRLIWMEAAFTLIKKNTNKKCVGWGSNNQGNYGIGEGVHDFLHRGIHDGVCVCRGGGGEGVDGPMRVRGLVFRKLLTTDIIISVISKYYLGWILNTLLLT